MMRCCGTHNGSEEGVKPLEDTVLQLQKLSFEEYAMVNSTKSYGEIKEY